MIGCDEPRSLPHVGDDEALAAKLTDATKKLREQRDSLNYATDLISDVLKGSGMSTLDRLALHAERKDLRAKLKEIEALL